MNVKVTPLDAWEFHDVTYAQSLEVVGEAIEVPGFDEEFEIGLEWHRSTETPKPDTEVLAEIKGFEHNRFAVLRWTKEGWWQHIPRMNDIMPSDGWIGTQGLFVIRWAYIEDRPQE